MTCLSSSIRILALLLLTGTLAACATPKPIRNLADQGAGTVALAEASLQEYIAATNAQLTARMDLVRQQSQQRARNRTRQQLDEALDDSAGVRVSEEMAKLIRGLGQQRAQLREAGDAELEKIAKATMLDPGKVAQVPTEKLAAAKKSFAVLAQELSTKEWLALTSGYAQEISDGIKSLKPPATNGATNAN